MLASKWCWRVSSVGWQDRFREEQEREIVLIRDKAAKLEQIKDEIAELERQQETVSFRQPNQPSY